MPQDQRILDLIAAASEKKPADVAPIVNELVGERVAALIDQRRDDTRANFFAEPASETEEDAVETEGEATEEQPAADTEEAPNGEDV